MEVWVPEEERTLVFLTNHLGFGPTTVARIYKARWQSELLFKALKQNLHVTTSWGRRRMPCTSKSGRPDRLASPQVPAAQSHVRLVLVAKLVGRSGRNRRKDTNENGSVSTRAHLTGRLRSAGRRYE